MKLVHLLYLYEEKMSIIPTSYDIPIFFVKCTTNLIIKLKNQNAFIKIYRRINSQLEGRQRFLRTQKH